MVNIGIIGSTFEGLTFLKFFTRYFNQYDIGYKLIKYDFLGERSDLSGNGEKKTIHPCRVVFREDNTRRAHTLFAPHGPKDRPVVRRGIITISRISKEIIASISLNVPLNEQLEFFNDVRFFPNEIYVWLLEREKLDNNRNDTIKEYKKAIKEHFEKRKVKVRRFYIVTIEFMLEAVNNRALESIFEIIKESEGEDFSKPAKKREYNNQAFEKPDISWQDLFDNSEEYVFLIGAGVSRNPPSSLPSAKEFTRYLIEACAPINYSKILEKLKFELVTEYIIRYLDKDLLFMDYFEEAHPPNFIHKFLAKAINAGHYILTTNFDYLIEKALMEIHINQSKIKPIITSEDYLQFNDFNILKRKDLLPIFKLHGSKKNIITEALTIDSLLVTISAYTKEKNQEDILEIKSFKKDILLDLIRDKNVVVMGYSGSDEFDIAPLLRLFPQLKSLIWISHVDNENLSIKLVNPIADSKKIEKIDDKLLIETANTVWYNIYKMEGKTLEICKRMWNLFFPDEKIPTIMNEINLNLNEWLSKKYFRITPIQKHYWAMILLYDIGEYNQSLKIAEAGLKFAKHTSEIKWIQIFNSQIGLIYLKLKNFKLSYEIFEKSMNNKKKKGNEEAIAIDLYYIGLVYEKNNQYNEALKYYEEAIKINEKKKEILYIAQNYDRIGNVYRKLNDYDKALLNYEKSHSLNKHKNNLLGQALNLLNMGKLYYKMENYNQSIKFYNDAFVLNNKLGKSVQITKILNVMGKIYFKMEKHEKSIECYYQAIKLADQLSCHQLKNKIERNIERLENFLDNEKLESEGEEKKTKNKKEVWNKPWDKNMDIFHRKL
ncbi:MAG: tetratricopeptide repeat protein [Promethearchaeota archaeon]